MSQEGKVPLVLGKEEIYALEIPFRELDDPPDISQGPLPRLVKLASSSICDR